MPFPSLVSISTKELKMMSNCMNIVSDHLPFVKMQGQPKASHEYR